METANWITIVTFLIGLGIQGAVVWGAISRSIAILTTRIENITATCRERGSQHKDHFANAEYAAKTLENHGIRITHVEGRVEKLEQART